ncbi:heme-binding protein [Sphingobium sp. EM0848]|uniref:GlcG/HbpS family heme-binding protein n=1 Tax=Sphingobium sp. EM0848 TaxID=2743473 RepID=UPI00159BF31A|nr:heme-binding protein [Sphingobium sp. EM0848]
MHTTLEKANRAIAAALQTGSELGLKPLTVAILDPGGHLISLQRQDGSSTLRPQIAIAKASGALAMGVSSRLIGEMAGERPTFIASLGPISPHGIVPAAGGVIIAAEDGTALGAIGVTGDTSDNDEICAFAGIAAIK